MDTVHVAYWHETDMPVVFRDVRFQGQNGKHLLGLSSSQFDPQRTSGLRSKGGWHSARVVPYLVITASERALTPYSCFR
jgi:hypothetical protein